jgi:uncharacterized membrane protein
MKKLLKLLILVFNIFTTIVLPFFYTMAFMFIAGTSDMTQWDMWLRIVFVVLGLPLLLAMSALIQKDIDEYKKP